MKINKKIWLTLFLLVLILAACNIPTGGQDEDFVFPTPQTLFPRFTRDPNATEPPTALPTLPPQPTPRLWPSPYFGKPGPTQITPVPTPASVFTSTESITFLLVGSDRRTATARTDTMIVVNYQPVPNIVTLISIPRDLFVYIPGWKMQRINAAYQHGLSSKYPTGGTGLLKDTILYNLGIEIDHVAMVNFQGFINIVDTLGGIEIPIACAYTDWHIIDPTKDPEDENNWELVTVGPGVVQMDGDLALWYARSRLKSDDFDRGRRQQEVIRALYQQAVDLNIVAHIPDLWNDFQDAVVTDLTLIDILALAPNFARMTSGRIRSYYINRDVVQGWRSPQGAALQLPEQPALNYLLQEALAPLTYQEEVHLDTLVEVWNGTPNPNWDDLAAERLNYGGFASSVSPADKNTYSSTVLVALGTNPDPFQSEVLLKLFGLPTDRLVYEPETTRGAEYRLILGTDFNPCFKPGKIER